MSITLNPLPSQSMSAFDHTVFVSGSTYYAVDTLGMVRSNASFTSLLGTIDSLMTSGGSIFICAGKYDIASSLTIANSINIYCAGRGRTVLNRTITGVSDRTLVINGNDVSIESFTIDGNLASASGCQFGELTVGGINTLVNDIEIKNYCAHGIDSAVSGLIVTNSVITGVALSGLSTFGIWCSGTNARSMIDSCDIRDNHSNAISAAGRTVVSNSHFAGNGINSVGQLGNTSGANITIVKNCVFESGRQGSYGIQISNGEWIVVGNTVSDCTNDGIVTDSGVTIPRLVIANNLVRNCSGNGIEINDSQKYFVIENNIVRNNQGYGITVTHSGANHYVIASNVVHDNISGQVNVLRTTTTNGAIYDNIMVSGGTAINLDITLGPNITNFVSGKTATYTAANSGAFGPAGYIQIRVSGNTVKIPYFTV
jgi:hypothetical protein